MQLRVNFSNLQKKKNFLLRKQEIIFLMVEERTLLLM